MLGHGTVGECECALRDNGFQFYCGEPDTGVKWDGLMKDMEIAVFITLKETLSSYISAFWLCLKVFTIDCAIIAYHPPPNFLLIHPRCLCLFA